MVGSQVGMGGIWQQKRSWKVGLFLQDFTTFSAIRQERPWGALMLWVMQFVNKSWPTTRVISRITHLALVWPMSWFWAGESGQARERRWEEGQSGRGHGSDSIEMLSLSHPFPHTCMFFPLKPTFKLWLPTIHPYIPFTELPDRKPCPLRLASGQSCGIISHRHMCLPLNVVTFDLTNSEFILFQKEFCVFYGDKGQAVSLTPSLNSQVFIDKDPMLKNPSFLHPSWLDYEWLKNECLPFLGLGLRFFPRMHVCHSVVGVMVKESLVPGRLLCCCRETGRKAPPRCAEGGASAALPPRRGDPVTDTLHSPDYDMWVYSLFKASEINKHLLM